MDFNSGHPSQHTQRGNPHQNPPRNISQHTPHVRPLPLLPHHVRHRSDFLRRTQEDTRLAESLEGAIRNLRREYMTRAVLSNPVEAARQLEDLSAPARQLEELNARVGREMDSAMATYYEEMDRVDQEFQLRMNIIGDLYETEMGNLIHRDNPSEHTNNQVPPGVLGAQDRPLYQAQSPWMPGSQTLNQTQSGHLAQSGNQSTAQNTRNANRQFRLLEANLRDLRERIDGSRSFHEAMIPAYLAAETDRSYRWARQPRQYPPPDNTQSEARADAANTQWGHQPINRPRRMAPTARPHSEVLERQREFAAGMDQQLNRLDGVSAQLNRLNRVRRFHSRILRQRRWIEVDEFIRPEPNPPDGECCGICLESEGTLHRLHGCNHLFHGETCLSQWINPTSVLLNQTNTCPICRRELFDRRRYTTPS